MAHQNLGDFYNDGGNLKKAKFHYEAGAMAGCEASRCSLGYVMMKSEIVEHANKHWMIAASAGSYQAMQNLLVSLKQGSVSRYAIDSTLTAYNDSCAEMVRSEAQDSFIRTWKVNNRFEIS
jgi:hypothetical protein